MRFAAVCFILVSVSHTAHAVPILIEFSVENATFYDATVFVAIDDFSGSVVFDLDSSSAVVNTGPGGYLNTTWDDTTPLELSSTTPYEAIIQSYSGQSQGLTQRRVLTTEWPSGTPSEFFPPSTAFLSSISLTRSLGLFSMELIGESEIFDVPGLDASSIPDNETFIAFLTQMENLKFVITGYGLNSSGGFTEYGQVIGEAAIQAVSSVPEPGTLALLTLGIAGILFVKRKRCAGRSVVHKGCGKQYGGVKPIAQAETSRAIGIVALSILVAGCATPRPQPATWNADSEAGRGEEFVELKSENGAVLKVIRTETLEMYSDICDRIAASAGENIELSILEVDEPNAFASNEDGTKYVIFTFGMVDLVGDDPDMVAGICGHEVAHHAHNHGEERDDHKKVVGVVDLAANVGLYLLTGTYFMGQTPLATLANTAYTREQETEADESGVRYMAGAGYDPQGAVDVMVKLEEARTHMYIPFFNTHPSSADRVAHIKAVASSTPHQ